MREHAVIGLLAVLSATTAVAGNVWQRSGPFSGSVLALAVAPSDIDVIYAATEDDGVYKSGDGGLSWSRAGLQPMAVTEIAISASDPLLVLAYARTITWNDPANGLFRSTDGGANWIRTETGSAETISAVAADPINGQVFYVGQGPDIFRTANGGQSWSLLPALEANAVSAILVDPLSPSRILAAADGAIYVSQNSGQSWTATGIEGTAGEVMVFDTPQSVGQQRRLWFGSQTSGLHWANAELLDQSFPFSFCTANGLDEPTSCVVHGVLALANNPVSNSTFIGTTNGLYVTPGLVDHQDPDSFWPAGQSIAAVAHRGSNGMIAARGSAGLGNDSRASKALAEPAARTIFITDQVGWGSSEPRESGLENAFLAGLAVDPQNPATRYVHGRHGIWKSTNGGMAWTQIVNGLSSHPSPWGSAASRIIDDIGAFAIDPANPSILFAGGDLGAVFRSTDGGTSWSQQGTIAPTSRVTSLAISPESSTTLWAAGPDGGSVWKSIDSGVTWTEVACCGQFRPSFVLVAPDDPALLYASGGSADVFRSSTGGASWSAVSLSDGVEGCSFDPANPRVMYCATTSAIWKSTNGGQSFVQLPHEGLQLQNNGRDTLTGVFVDAHDSSLYAGSNRGLFRSTDGGATWGRVGADTRLALHTPYFETVAGNRRVSVAAWGGGVQFIEPATPAIASISPQSGPSSGGTPVTLHGEHLTGSTVSVGGTAAVVTASSDTSMTFVTPAHDPGSFAVVVANGSVSAAAPSPFNYTFLPPAHVSAVSDGVSVTVTWTAVPDAAGYEVLRRAGGAESLYATVPADTSSMTDPSVAPGNAYVYRIRALHASGATALSERDVAVVVAWSDATLDAGLSRIRAQHVEELRTAVNAIRNIAGQPDVQFTVSPGALIRAAHVQQLRTALNQARTVLGLPGITFNDPALTPGVSVVRAVHVLQLRSAMN